MRILVFISILFCKLSGFILRIAGRGGTNLPGKIALKICPNVLRYMSRGVTTLVVTGTNGKTTTSRMLEECYKRAGFDYFANKSGANLLSGVTAEFARSSNLFGKNRHKYALIECDEAAFKQVSRFVDAKCIIVTNIFRDQLDRYGEITHTLNSIEISVKNSPNATLCLNADCSLTSSLAEFAGKDIVWYGLETPIYKDGAVELSDAMYCLKCKHPYKYDYHTFAHLGAWRCENCGYSRTEPEVAEELGCRPPRLLEDTSGEIRKAQHLGVGRSPVPASAAQIPGGAVGMLLRDKDDSFPAPAAGYLFIYAPAFPGLRAPCDDAQRAHGFSAFPSVFFLTV